MSGNPSPSKGPASQGPTVRHGIILASVAALVVLVAACAPPKRAFPGPLVSAKPLPETVTVRVAGRITSVPLDEYVLGAVLSEVTPVGETEATVARIYEVQAIVARTYVLSQLGRHHQSGFDVCDTTHCQLYEPARITTSRFAEAARAAVARTTGRVLTYGGHVAEALFHADCGGSTTSADAVWGGPAIPYLHAVVDTLPAETHRTWQATLPADQLRQALDADPRTDVGRTLTSIEILSRDASGRASGLTLQGERSYTVRGDVLRAIVNQKFGDRTIQSTKFAITRTRTQYTFKGTGFGHGVGLCQRGAITRARQGESVEQILLTYFPGATLGR